MLHDLIDQTLSHEEVRHGVLTFTNNYLDGQRLIVDYGGVAETTYYASGFITEVRVIRAYEPVDGYGGLNVLLMEGPICLLAIAFHAEDAPGTKDWEAHIILEDTNAPADPYTTVTTFYPNH